MDQAKKLFIFVLNLNKRGKDIRKLLNKIENCIIDILREYKISSYRDNKNIGIWVGNKKNSMKIAAIGIRVKKMDCLPWFCFKCIERFI